MVPLAEMGLGEGGSGLLAGVLPLLQATAIANTSAAVGARTTLRKLVKPPASATAAAPAAGPAGRPRRTEAVRYPVRRRRQQGPAAAVCRPYRAEYSWPHPPRRP